MFLKSKLPVLTIAAERFHSLVDPAELIVSDLNGPKVMRLHNGHMIKLFRRKRLISSAQFAPYAIRFVNNALKLKQLDIPTVTPVRVMHCKDLSIHIVEYEPLEGELLRRLLQRENNEQLFEQTARFIAELHLKGIYFRSLHFENVVYHKGQLGLIDIADMKIYRRCLGNSLRQRNFQHFLRYPADNELISQFGQERFESIYNQALSREPLNES
jgi:hypothetical protein